VYAGRETALRISRTLPVEVTVNSLPPGDGIALFEEGKAEPDWTWPDYVITVGNVEIGRNHRDAHLSGPDYEGQLYELLESIFAEVIDEDENIN
jgi:hypothetical protein